MGGTLYLIPNTLGPVDDAASLDHVIPRFVQQKTAQLEYFIAENAKTARAFLKALSQNTPLAQPIQQIRIAELNIQTAGSALPSLLAPIIGGMDGGLISEAGVPAVADPGADLVRLAHAHQVPVKPLVGPSSILLAVMASGLNGQSFAFNGYLPVDAAQRSKRIRELEQRSRQEKQTQAFIETPYRNAALLEALATNCSAGTLLCVATDLTLKTESICTQTAADWKRNLLSDRAPALHKRPTIFLLLAQ